MDKRIIWVDLETTGLYPDWDEILEIAVVITNEKLEVLSCTQDVIHRSDESLKHIEEVVFNMHTKSGLLSEVKLGTSIYQAQENIFQMFQDQRIPRGYYPLAGNSVHFDRAFLDMHLADVSALVSNRNIDVSAIHELAKVWAPDVAQAAPKKKRIHRALEDIMESIEELRYYKKTFFK